MDKIHTIKSSLDGQNVISGELFQKNCGPPPLTLEIALEKCLSQNF